MANIKSQMKRNKTNEVARQRNKAVKSKLRTHVREARAAIAEGDAEKAAELTAVANRALDKAVSKGVIHANQAANRKSALSSATAALQA
ncbi:30S ribosomal protein S20 [Tessaracoccus timonensis]|uniref:30S ribosomal protein S20 n=1 Tax=Tessaracoccus timonensis TaxID=2161816 RepID=UPI000D55D1F4|nr:30S ribosomal protein S20 [Tessaracoccus timonensis]